MVAHSIGKKIAETNTKIAFSLQGNDDLISLQAKPGHKVKDKAVYNTQIAFNVFRLLKLHGIPNAFWGKLGRNNLFQIKCDTWSCNVKVRGKAYGTYLKRHPGVARGQEFESPVVEWFLTAPDRKWNDRRVPVYHSLLVMEKTASYCYLLNIPLSRQKPIFEIGDLPAHRQEIEDIAVRTFTVLRDAWASLGYDLADIKLHFGTDRNNNVLLVGYIDHDHWRLAAPKTGNFLKKTDAHYRWVAEMSRRLLNSV